MKTKLILMMVFAGVISLTSCEKSYMGPVDETGAPVELRDGEETESDQADTDDENITDTGHDSDYDKGTNKKKKPSGGGA